MRMAVKAPLRCADFPAVDPATSRRMTVWVGRTGEKKPTSGVGFKSFARRTSLGLCVPPDSVPLPER